MKLTRVFLFKLSTVKQFPKACLYWVRIFFHPIMSDDEVVSVCNAIKVVAMKVPSWKKEYRSTPHGYIMKNSDNEIRIPIEEWFV